MKRVRFSHWLVSAAAAAFALQPFPARATEAGGGHSITGALAAPGSGIVPPQPGLYWANVNMYYGASTSKSLQLPVAGNLVTGLSADFSSFAFGAVYVAPVKLGPVTIAAGITLPFQYMDANAVFGARSRSDTSGGFGDMIITPAILGVNAGPHFFQARVDIFAPTGPYRQGSLANIGMNYWTFTPTVAYSYFNPALGIDVSANLGVDLNTRNKTTNYTSGALLHFDTAVTRNIGSTGLRLGALFALMSQIQDDKGGLASRLGGFRGQSFAVGPVIAYEFKLGRMDVNSSLRWAPEFATTNRLAGNLVALSFAGRF